MNQTLSGTALAGRVRAQAAVQIAALREKTGVIPTLAAVAVDPGDDASLYFDVKERAFQEAGAHFLPHILPGDCTTDQLITRINALNADPGVHAIYVQYPLPSHILSQAAYDQIRPELDVDGAGSASRNSAGLRFRPATAEAVIRLLEQHAIELRERDVCIVRGDPLFALHLADLFDDAHARPAIRDLDDGDLAAVLGTADVVVAATGVVNGVSATSFADDVVAVDVGYYHGGGRGDIEAAPADIARMRAYAPPRGAIGPLTVAILIEHTIAAAVATLGTNAT